MNATTSTLEQQAETGAALRFITCGSVDDGKSTLIGRLLVDSKTVLQDQLAGVQRGGETDLALLTDGLRAEREQGITIDVAYRYFATANRSFVLADCPGHVQYTRNTVTGSSTADVVVLLVDARKGVLEQTRRHLAVTALLRVPHVVVAVNKIDLVDFSQEVYERVEAEVQAVARELGVVDAIAIPVSALDGDNIAERSERTPWYGGPSLLELLEALPPSDDPSHESFRLSVQLVIRPQGAARDDAHRDYRGYAGQVASGVVRVGDEVVALPSGRRTTVVGIDLGEQPLDEAFAPQSVTLRLADEIDLSRGDVIAAVADAPEPTQDIKAVVCWLGDAPLRPGQRLLLKHGSRTVQTAVRSLDGALDLDGLHAVASDALSLNDIGLVTLRLASPLPVENYSVSRRGGSFLLIDAHDGRTVAAGMVGATLPTAAPAPTEPEGDEKWEI